MKLCLNMRIEGPVCIYFTFTIPRYEKQGTYTGVFVIYTFPPKYTTKTMLYFHREVVEFLVKMVKSYLAYLTQLRRCCFQQQPWSTPQGSSRCSRHHTIPPHNHRWHWHCSARTEGNLCPYKLLWTQQWVPFLERRQLVQNDIETMFIYIFIS